MTQGIPIYRLGIYADKYPVTVGEYRAYRSQYKNPWENTDPDPKLPATGITWQEANVYCEFFGKRLPNTREWIYCATGMMLIPIYSGDGFEVEGERRLFPWGNEMDPKRCNCAKLGKNRPTPVDYFDHKGESAFGLSDMMGNVWEMTSTYFGESTTGKSFEDDDKRAIDNRTIIGGYFKNELLHGGIAGEGVLKMDMLLEDAGNEIIGFRCVRDFSEQDVFLHAVDIQKSYRERLLCDRCGNEVPPRGAKAIGSERHSISIYCDACFVKEVEVFVRSSHPEHQMVFYGFAVGFLIAYMRGDVRGGDYVYREGGLEEYARRCRLQCIRPSKDVDVEALIDRLERSAKLT